MLDEVKAARRRNAAARVALPLNTTHDQIDDAIGEGGALLSMLMRARRDSHISGTIGQDIVDEVLSGISSLVASRGSFIRVHVMAGEIAERLGVTPTSEGDVWPKEPWAKASDDGQTPLRESAHAA